MPFGPKERDSSGFMTGWTAYLIQRSFKLVKSIRKILKINCYMFTILYIIYSTFMIYTISELMIVLSNYLQLSINYNCLEKLP